MPNFRVTLKYSRLWDTTIQASSLEEAKQAGAILAQQEDAQLPDGDEAVTLVDVEETDV